MKRRRLGAAAATAIAAVLLVASGSVSSGTTAGATPQGSARYGFWVTVPAGWHRSSARLVPKLLAPREIVSLGNFGMRVGGGGNCGREPAVSIKRMRSGDALVTLQEVPVFPKLRSHLRRRYPPRPRHLDFADLRGTPNVDGRTARVRSATIAFSAHGRAFEALVYTGGPPTPALRADIDAILAGLRFRPGSWDHFHGDELPAT